MLRGLTVSVCLPGCAIVTLPILLREHGFTTYAMTLSDDAVPIDAIEPAERSAVIVGSEGPGLSEHWQRE